MYETDPTALLKEMRDRHIAVEINLTSNDVILGVRGDEHPLPIYRKFGVPVSLSTDDEGVSRSRLTEEFARAVELDPSHDFAAQELARFLAGLRCKEHTRGHAQSQTQEKVR